MKFRHLSYSIIFALSTFFVFDSVNAQEQPFEQDGLEDVSPEFERPGRVKRVRLTVDLTQQDLAQLRRDGRLRLRIPEFYYNRVAAILLRYVDTYVNEKVRVSGEPKVFEDVSQVRLDELMVERLQYQPIEFRVFEKNFTEVEIHYVAEPLTRIYVADDDQELTREEYQVQIMNRLSLNAKISRMDQLKLNSDLGEFTIPWSKVDKVQFGELGAATAKLFLKDGSAVSGQLEIEALDIKTRWGKITIPANDLSLISR